MQSEKRPLVFGLAAASLAVWLLLRWPPTPVRDLAWAGLLVAIALSIAEFGRRTAQRGQRLPPLKWIALAFAALGLAQGTWSIVQGIFDVR